MRRSSAYKLVEPFWVTYAYSEEQQNKPIKLVAHDGQEFDIILSGSLKIQIGEHAEILHEGDSIYYNSSTPHGMIAVDGKDCVFCAVVIPGEPAAEEKPAGAHRARRPAPLVFEQFIETVEDERGTLQSISFKNKDRFNFAFDVVDELAARKPEKLAMLHVDRNKTVRRFTFGDISRASSRAANYFRSLGIKKGDRVMLVLKRNYQFWISIIALHKLGAVVIPATDQLLEKDFVYRFNAAGVTAIVCSAESNAPAEAERAMEQCPQVTIKVIASGQREGWRSFDEEYQMFRSTFPRTEDTPCGDDLMLMYFTSVHDGLSEDRGAIHTRIHLAILFTAKYLALRRSGRPPLHDIGYGHGASLSGASCTGQWLVRGGGFYLHFDRFDANDILPMFKEHNITTYLRAAHDIPLYDQGGPVPNIDLSSIKYATHGGRSPQPRVFNQFKKATGLSIMEGFGQTETTLVSRQPRGTRRKSVQWPSESPFTTWISWTATRNPVGDGRDGEIRHPHPTGKSPAGLFMGYYLDEEERAPPGTTVCITPAIRPGATMKVILVCGPNGTT